MNDSFSYPRDMQGYGEHPPHAQWPRNARIAVQFVLNYEEGGENCVLHGDQHSETFLSDIIGAQAYRSRHMSMESLYEYGSRAGVWRILKEFRKRELPLTVFGVTMAMARTSVSGACDRTARAAHGRAPAGLVHRSGQPEYSTACR